MAIETQDKGGRREQPGSPVEALDGVLDALQGMLERRHVVPPGTHGHAADRATVPERGTPSHPADAEDLPVLDQVVIPGASLASPPGPVAPKREPARVVAAPPIEPATEPLEPLRAPTLPAYDDLVKRLMSEVEVIIENSLDDALARARKEIRARIKQHLDIVLPAILEELKARDVRGEE